MLLIDMMSSNDALHSVLFHDLDTFITRNAQGQLVLNGNTEVKSMPDKGKRMYCFEVTCGKTGTPFEICSDDQRSKHEWMLAIKKVWFLQNILEIIVPL